MTRPCSQTHVQCYWVWYCIPDAFMLRVNPSLMLLLILKILLLGQALQPNLKLLGITLQKNLTFLDLDFFLKCKK